MCQLPTTMDLRSGCNPYEYGWIALVTHLAGNKRVIQTSSWYIDYFNYMVKYKYIKKFYWSAT